LGNIQYFDRLKVRHMTLFARRYDPGKGRFVPIEENHDYEGFE
jgi:hypothetical protein